MVELYIAAWHRGRGHTIHLVEQEGWPDLRVDIPQVASPLLIECKRIERPSENRINAVVKKANQQIKQAKQELGSPYCGVVVLDIATQCTVELLPGQTLPYMW